MKKSNFISWTSSKVEVISGKFEVYNGHVNGNKESWAKGNVTCMVFQEDSKKVRMTGVITESDNPGNLGKYAIWVAEDNGKAMIKAATDSGDGINIGIAAIPSKVGFERELYEEGI